MPDEKKETAVEETVEELFTDPDAPEKGDADRPPQTIENEPSGGATTR